MNLSPRCLARTRRGSLCQSPAVRNRKRCRIHGGAKGSGAPQGNQNALKHGKYSARVIAERREMMTLIRENRAFLKQMQEEEF